MRNTLIYLVTFLVCGCATSNTGALEQRSTVSPMPQGELQVEIQSPSSDLTSVDGITNINQTPRDSIWRRGVWLMFGLN